ncbi:velvet factor [Syncephalis plumigaleata]|nr:velvet factor [Syncephalis plumigaleata]
MRPATTDAELRTLPIISKGLCGQLVSSLHRLKDITNEDAGFFIFPDTSARMEGVFRLRFSLYEIRGAQSVRLCSVHSDPFTVYPPRSFPGMSESTFLSRSFSDQGVRIRIRKESRYST